MSGRLVVRELATPEEFIETTSVSKAAWGFASRDVSPVNRTRPSSVMTSAGPSSGTNSMKTSKNSAGIGPD